MTFHERPVASIGQHPEYHSLHRPLDYPDLDAPGHEFHVMPPGVDYDFDSDFETQEMLDASRLAWEAMSAQLKQK